MQIDIAQLESCLRGMSLDTGKELELLRGTTQKQASNTILVTGDQQADLYSLLPTPGQLFFGDESVPFPLVARYADTFSIQVSFDGNKTEIYQSVVDFRKFCVSRLGQIRHCQVSFPDLFFRSNQLIFVTLDQNMQQIAADCVHCNGCVLVTAADAGGLSEDYLDLCRWLTEEICIARRVTLLLNNCEGFGNPMLEFMTQSVLNRDALGVIRCGSEGMSAEYGLKAAVADIQERSLEGVSEAVVLACCGRVRQMLLEAIEREEKKAWEARIMEEKYQTACKNYRAMCVTEQYAFPDILSKEEKETLVREIKDLFERLRTAFPGMMDQVVKKSPTPKEDLRNLSGDYLGALINSYMECILNEVLEDVLVPRTRDRFRNLCERFRRMMQDAQLEYTQIEDNAQTQFLKMAEVNIGDYHTPLAQITGMLLTAVMKLSLSTILNELGLGQLGYYLGEKLENVVHSAVVSMTDALIPTRQYVAGMIKVLLKQTEELEEQILRQIQQTILPRMSTVLQTEFQALANVYYNQLRRQAEEYGTLRRRAESNLTDLKADLAALDVIAPA